MPIEPLDSRQLRALMLVADKQSFTLAAKELNLTQSAVSHAIKSLEKDVNCSLVDRVGKRADLTEAGRKLLRSAQIIFTEMVNIRQELQKSTRWGQSTLRIGATTSICQYLLPPVLREFKESFPECTVNIVPGDTPEILSSLQQNSIDIAIALQPFEADFCGFRPLFKDELKFILSPIHSWNNLKNISQEQLKLEKYILYNKRSHTYRLIDIYFRALDIELPSSLELGSMEAIKELVKVGMGVSIGAEWVAAQELQEGSLTMLPLGRKKLYRNWGLMYRKGRRLSITEETLFGLCSLAAENLMLPQK
ncbi:MAG: LysR family transcriptional regulator [Verrucomicrobiota bacterium]